MLINVMIWKNACDQSKCPARNGSRAYDLSKHMPSSPHSGAISTAEIDCRLEGQHKV